MKYTKWYILLLLIEFCACQPPNPRKITMEDLQDSSNRTMPLQEKNDYEDDIIFYDTQEQIISPDKFNQLLAEGLYLSISKKQANGKEEMHLIHTIEHEKKLEDLALPSFEITDLAGKSYNPTTIKGKVTILSFWNLASKLCVQDISNLNPLAKKYQEKNNVLWLGLMIGEANDLSKMLKLDHWYYNFAAEQELTSKFFGILTYPTHLIINEKGDIIKAIVRNSNSGEIIDHTLAKIVK